VGGVKHSAALILHTLRPQQAVPLYAATDSPPKRLVVLPWGRNASRRGDFVVNEDTAKVFAANQQKNRIDGKQALDFEHNTLPGTPAYESSSEPRPIAAWALCRVIPYEGIVYEDIEWTPDGLSAWQRKLYQDLSPAPVRGADGKTVIAMHSTALCRHGELEDLTIDHAAAPKALAAYFEALSASDPTLPTPTPPTPRMKAKLIALLAALGVTLDPNADEAATSTALDEALKKYNDEEKKEDTETANPKNKAEAEKPESMSAELASVRAEVEQLREENLISEATRDGKVVPLSAEAIKITPLSAIAELVKNAKPGEVHTEKKDKGGKDTTTTENPNAPVALSAEEKKMAEMMGLSEADALKFGKGVKDAK